MSSRWWRSFAVGFFFVTCIWQVRATDSIRLQQVTNDKGSASQQALSPPYFWEIEQDWPNGTINGPFQTVDDAIDDWKKAEVAGRADPCDIEIYPDRVPTKDGTYVSIYEVWPIVEDTQQGWKCNGVLVPKAEQVLSALILMLDPSNENNADPGKNLGDGKGCDGGEGDPGDESNPLGSATSTTSECLDGTPMEADPINTATGDKFQQDTDIELSHWLTFRRFYNSSDAVSSSTLGAHWRHSFDRSLQVQSTDTEGGVATLARPDGKREKFKKLGSEWTTSSDVPDVLVELDGADGKAAGYTVFVAGTRQFETYAENGLLQSVRDESGFVTSFVYSSVDTPSNIAPASGLLLKVTDPYGRTLAFTYDGKSRINKVQIPDGGSIEYGYDANNNLSSVHYPDGKERKYQYGEDLVHELIGVVDEGGVLFERTGYDHLGRAVWSSFAEGADETYFMYQEDGSVRLRTPLGGQTDISFQNTLGRSQVSASSRPCGTQCRQPWSKRTYDKSGYPATFTDFNGNVTSTQYDSQGLLVQRIEAKGLESQRTTDFTWDAAFRVPMSRTVSDASGHAISKTQWLYNANGQPLARCDIDPSGSVAKSYTCSDMGDVPVGVRRWTYTYCTAVDTVRCPLAGLTLAVTGPRSNLMQTTSYSYYSSSSAVNCGTPGAACYQAGDLHTITDALGHVTTIGSYDANGRVTRITDANGINTDLAYSPRGWLSSRSVGSAITYFTYTPYGAVQTITDPDGVTTTYSYDTAHRLIKITDSSGNYIQYTLDASGNRTSEKVYDSEGVMRKSIARTFNDLGQLTQVRDGFNRFVFDASDYGSYDPNGNLLLSYDARTKYKYGYDALNRLVQTLDNYNGNDAATRNTKTIYSYDGLDRLNQVTDPDNLATAYSYDGLSNAVSQVTPDTGTTNRTFDAAGNVLTRTDAKGITATSTYDALNRLISTSYPDSTQNITYSYDDANTVTGCSASYPIGRLTRIIENAVTTVYCYDARGNVITKNQSIAETDGLSFPIKLPDFGNCPPGRMCIAGEDPVITDTTSYSYTAAGRLSAILYPMGTQVSYTRDHNGRVQEISVVPSSGAASTVVSGVTYQPFGPVNSYTLGNGQTITRTYDANYRLIDLTSPAFNLHVARDAMGDITAIGNVPGANPATETYSYDPLYRLTAVTEADRTVLESVTYNPSGDRLSKTGSGLATGAYSYNTNTHQLIATGNAARTVDANGNSTAISEAGNTYGFGYSDRNRMAVAQLAGSTIANYTYNALNERIQKVAGAATERYDYNETSQMLGEYGATNRDYIWMDGIPVANVDTAGSASTISYVVADQLGTPRSIADSSGTTIWQWAYQGNPWGEVQPTSNGYVYNLRFAGQYYDAETGLYSNGSRPYDPSSGRFAQPDSIGQMGGIGLYLYVSNNPLSNVDPSGLQQTNELDPKAAEELNTPETNTEVARLEEQAKEEAGAKDDTPALTRDPSEFGEFGTCSAVPPNRAVVGPQGGTNFIVTPQGTAYPVPNGANGPKPADNGQGMQFQGGSGGNGLDPRTSGFRYMDPITSGPYQYPDGYGSYNNASGQTVNPYTGQTIAPSNPMWHIPNGN